MTVAAIHPINYANLIRQSIQSAPFLVNRTRLIFNTIISYISAPYYYQVTMDPRSLVVKTASDVAPINFFLTRNAFVSKETQAKAHEKDNLAIIKLLLANGPISQQTREQAIEEAIEELLSPGDDVLTVASMMNTLNKFPKDTNLTFLIKEVNRFNTPKMSADTINKIIELYLRIPQSTWTYYTTKIQEIKGVCRSSEELYAFAEDLIPDKKKLAKIAIYSFGSSITLKTANFINTNPSHPGEILALFNSLLDEVESDFVKKMPTTISHDQRKLINGLNKTRKIIRDSFIINQELKKLGKVNLKVQVEIQAKKIVTDVMAKLSFDETIILPWLFSSSGHHEGHSLSLEINRQSDGRFNITVYNTGLGINHHKNIYETSKYYPVVIKDIDSTTINIDRLQEFVMGYGRSSSLPLEEQLNAFYTFIKSLGIQDDETARAYNYQGRIGNCSLKCLTKIMHDKLGSDYEFIKILMHQKLYNQLISTAETSILTYDIATSQDFSPFIKELQDRYSVSTDDIQELISDNITLRINAYSKISRLLRPTRDVDAYGIISALLTPMRDVDAVFSLDQLLDAAEYISLMRTAESSDVIPVESLVLYMNVLRPRSSDQAKDIGMAPF